MVFLVVLLMLLVATPAGAATVIDNVEIVDEAGEANAITIEATASGVRISDAGADLVNDATDTCTSESARVVVCEGRPEFAHVYAGGLDDTVDVSGRVGVLLVGGPGDDELRGGAGRDTLIGGPGADAMNGGAGRDVAEYRRHAHDLVIDLTREDNQGAAGEADSLTNVEDAIGGRGDDVLTGNGQENDLRGSAGADTLRGSGGDDTLVGDDSLVDSPADLQSVAGHDDADGGPGDDQIVVGRHSVAHGGSGDDHVISYLTDSFGGRGADLLVTDLSVSSCGAGRDAFGLGYGRDPTFVARDCERVEPYSNTDLVVRPLRRERGEILVRMSCAAVPACDGRISITQARSVLARRRFKLTIHKPRLLRMPLLHQSAPGMVRVTLSKIWGDAPFRYDTLF
jgi:Ca2+-binding RTX toxin-like protein